MPPKLPKGMYWEPYSIKAVVNIAAGRSSRRFDHDTPIVEIKHWRAAERVRLETMYPQRKAGMHGHKTFNAEIKRYMKTLAIASWKSRLSELRAWAKHWGGKRRRKIGVDDAKAVIKIWFDAGVPAKTIVNRCRALTAMCHALDGETAWTPLQGVKIPKPVKRLPDYVPVDTIRAVEAQLRAAGDAKTHARYMVLTATGARPAHLKRTRPDDVDLERRIWRMSSVKGGVPVPMHLNDDFLAAFEWFVLAEAWGDFDATAYAKALRAAGWPKGIRPYTAKHSVGQDLGKAGVPLDGIRGFYGHQDEETSRIYTGDLQRENRAASEAINGRLGWKRPDRFPDTVPSTAAGPPKLRLVNQLAQERPVE